MLTSGGMTGLRGVPAGADDRLPLGGGAGIVVNGDTLCTLTTIGTDGKGELIGFTSAHCGGPGAVVAAEAAKDRGTVGTMVAGNDNLDYAVIQFDPGHVTPVNRIGNVTITNVGAPAQFPAIVCKEGRTTGNTCGLAFGDVFQTDETWAEMCVVEGDSGAPVVIGTTLVGMVNAYLAVACFGPEVGTNMSAIVNDMNGRGGVGAGYAPI